MSNSAIYKRTIWREVDHGLTEYVPRCSYCGKYRQKLMQHWFYTGLYCIPCVQDVLYDNARNIGEINES